MSIKPFAFNHGTFISSEYKVQWNVGKKIGWMTQFMPKNLLTLQKGFQFN